MTCVKWAYDHFGVGLM